MRVQYLASATVLIEHNGTRILCDPWLTSPIYGGAWYHNPPLAVTPEDFSDIDGIYISHIHEDHAATETLKRLPKVPVYIAAYAEPFLKRKLEGLGFQVYELEAGGWQFESGLRITVYSADGCNPQLCGKWIGCQIANPKDYRSYQIDSLAVFEGGGRTVINTNDCPYELSKSVLDRLYWHHGTRVDLLLVGYGGAGPYPQCFVMADEDRRTAAEAKRAAGLAQARQFIDHLKPRHYLPFAGQYTLGGPLVDMNDARGVPEIEDLDDWGDERMIRLNRGAWFNCETGTASEPFTPVSREARVAYRETLRAKPLDHESDPMPETAELNTLVEQAQEQLWRRCEARGITSQWHVRINQRYIVTFTRPFAGQLVGFLDITVDPRLLKRIVTRSISMNNCEVGSLLTYHRTPDVFDRGAFNALSYFHI